MSRWDEIARRREAARAHEEAPAPKKQPSLKALARLESVGKRRHDLAAYELDRICTLPVSRPSSPAELEDLSRRFLLGDAFDSGFRLFAPQAEAVRDYDAHGGLFGPVGVGWGKCVCGSTEIFDVASGRRRRVDDVGTLSVPSVRFPDKRIQARPATSFPSGLKPCVELCLAAGQITRLSTDHPVLSRRGWIAAGALALTDHVATAATVPPPAQYARASDDDVVLAAYMAGDGNLTGKHFRFTQMPGPVLEEFKRVVCRLGGCWHAAKTSHSGLAWDYGVCRLLPWARRLGLACSAKTKRLPADWYGLSDRQCALFLSRIWACDGWLEKDRAAIALSNHGLLSDIRFLLLRLGITARFDYRPKVTSWRLTVSGGTNLQRFQSALGTIPGKPWPDWTGRASKAVLYDQDIRWVKVRSVSPIGEQEVYDLNVPDTGNFIGDGLVLHNTGIALMIASHAHAKGLRRIVLLVPPSVFDQLTKSDIPWWRRRVPLNVPFHLLGKRSRAARLAMARSGRRGCYVVPYSLLSTTDAVDIMDALRPELVIADEAHNLARRNAARTKRFLHYLEARADADEPVELVAMSGTVTNKSVTDYHHLLVAALKAKAPVPVTQALAAEWGSILDAGASVVSEHQAGPIMPLVRWAQRTFPGRAFRPTISDFREAYKLRLTTAPGVVATGDNEIGCSLTIANRAVAGHERAPGWARLRKLISQVEEAFLTPNGDEIDYSIHAWKWLYELSSGFYNELVWQTPEALAKDRGIAEGAAKVLLDRALDHHRAEQEYHRDLRRFLEEAPIGLDTPMEVGRACAQRDGRVPGDLYRLWSARKDLDFVGMPERLKRAVRVCPFKVDAAVAWAAERAAGCMVWYDRIEVGQWLAEALRESDLHPLHCPAGADDQLCAVGDPERGGRGDRVVVASINAHGTGKNLQAFQEQLFVQWPRSAKTAEQALGRLHRNGQTADELTASRMDTTEFDIVNFAACLNDAVYVQQTTGGRQKVVYANYDPLPRVFSPEFLRARGAQVKVLNAEQRQMLSERFGDWEDRT